LATVFTITKKFAHNALKNMTERCRGESLMKPYNPLKHAKKYDLDWTEGTLRVIEDGGRSVIFLEAKDGEIIVLNIVEEASE
jgi:hypothetical protein